MMYSVIFAITVGIVMIGQWLFLYASKQISELEHEPIRIWFHIVAEVITALLLVISGIALLVEKDWARTSYLISVGMLFYTSIVSPGYFAQKGDWKWVGVFSTLIWGGVASLIPLI